MARSAPTPLWRSPAPTLPFYALMTKNVRLLWVFIYETEAAALALGQQQVAQWLAEGSALHPAFHVFGLEEAAAAHEAVEAGAVGKVLLRLDGE